MPPVTAERSPPASRMTGADSPVMADSLTEATPSRFAVAGDDFAGLDEDDVVELEIVRVDDLETAESGSSGST